MLVARGAFAEAESLRERLLGPEYHDTLIAVGNLAVVLGKFSEARLRAASSHGRVAFL